MTIHQKFTGDSSQLVKEYQNLAAQNTRLEQKVGALTQRMGEGVKSGKRDFDLLGQSTKFATGALTGMLASWFSIATAISLVNQEVARHKQLADEALATHQSLAAAQADLYLNAFGKSPDTVAGIQTQLRRLATDAKVPEKAITQAYASAQSTGVGTDKMQMDAVRMAAELSAQRPENIGNLSKSILMGQQLTGASAEEVAALFLSGGASAFMENPEQQSRMLRQTMAGVMASSGGDKRRGAEQGIELGAALTTMVGEERGESARTAALSLSGQLNTFFTEGFEKTVNGHKFRVKPKVADPGGVLDRLRVLQNDPKLAKQFLEQANFEELFKAPIRRAILDKNSEEAKRITEAEQKVSYDTKPLQPLREQLRRGTTQIELDRTNRERESNKEQREIANTRFAREAAANKIVEDSLAQTAKFSNTPWGLKWAGDALDENFTRPVTDAITGGNPLDSAIQKLEFRRRAVLKPGSGFLGKNMGRESRKLEQLSADERGAVEYLDKQIALLKEMRNQELSEQRPSPPPQAAPPERSSFAGNVAGQLAAGPGGIAASIVRKGFDSSSSRSLFEATIGGQLVQLLTKLLVSDSAAVKAAEGTTKAIEENTKEARETNQILRERKPVSAPAAREERGRHRER